MSVLSRRIVARYLLAKWVNLKVEATEVEATEVEVANGQAGTLLTWQAPFPLTTPCMKCGKPARVALGLRETGGEGSGSICFIHQNTHRPDKEGEGGFWPHDCTAMCVYFCTNIGCTTVTTLWNQA